MFKKARIKLTAWYSVIIMVVSLSFSVAIYSGINRELIIIDDIQKSRQQRVDTISNFLIEQGLPVPPENQPLESETVEDIRLRILWALGLINLSILVVSGIGGYLLAGFTLDPISQMVKSQKEFVSNASHELRTPLTSLKTEIEVALRDKKLSLKDAKNLLKSNLEDVNGMQRLSNYLLKLNRYGNSEISLKIQKLDLGKITQKAIENVFPYANQNNIKIVSDIKTAFIKGNEDAILELETIIIDNAIKYSGSGKTVVVSIKKDGLLMVRDFGVGISESDIPHIFDRFFRSDISRSKEKVDGYGLGLSIAKTISDRMGAKIKVQSKVGKGTIFAIHFQTV